MKNFFSRVNAKGIVSTLILSLAMSACSSKQGANSAIEDEASASEMQAEEDMMMGEGGSEVVADDSSFEDATDGATVVGSNAPSLPRQAGVWKGTLKSQYTPGMTEWTVGRGESLSLIAGAVFGKSRDWKKLVALNPEITDPNNINPGQKLRLVSSDEYAQVDQAAEPTTNTPVVGNTQQNDVTTAPSEPMPTVSNTDPSAAPTAGTVADSAATAPAAGADAAAPPSDAGTMGVVDNAQAPTTAQVDAAAPSTDGSLSNMIKKVDMSGGKAKLRNILLGVAAFFLLLSGVIFVLSRRKSKAG